MEDTVTRKSARYSAGYQDSSKAMSERSAASHAAFFLPYISKGIRLLDVGCGPGTITLDLARAVAPGSVTGVDIAESEVARAQENARAGRVTNAEFRTASVYELPFGDCAFDAVFSNALFEHLGEPVLAAKEILRVLRPGGLAGIRTTAISRIVWWPYDETLAGVAALWAKVGTHNGGDFDRALRLPQIVQDAGFERVQATAAYSPDARVVVGVVRRLREPDLEQLVTEQRWITKRRLDRLLAAADKWSAQPGAMLWSAWGEVVTRKAS